MKQFLFLLFFSCSLFGVDYFHIEPNIHVLKVDPKTDRIIPKRAHETEIGRETVHTIATTHKATAAVNGGFFSPEGISRGALKIGEWIALPIKPRGCIGWSSNDQNPLFDRMIVSVHTEKGKINGLNRERKPHEAILYTSIFHPTTRTDEQGEELIIEEGVIADVLPGNSPIPEDGSVLSIGKLHPWYGTFSVGDPVSFEFHTLSPLATSEFVVGGTPILLCDGEVVTDFSPEQTIETFLTHRHARTGVGLLPSGEWLFVVVDKGAFLGGMTMTEFANFFAELGCTHALNLDGGGSSTMVYQNRIVNTPRGDVDEDDGLRKVRKVSDAILIYSQTEEKTIH